MWYFIFPRIDFPMPGPFDLLGVLAVLGAGMVMVLAGRALTRGHGTPELHLLAGWGALSALLTFWGVTTATTMAIPAGLFAAGAIATLAVPSLRPERDEIKALGRVLALSLPLWLVIASIKPFEPDTITNFLPNAAYLFDHGAFPFGDRAPTVSFWPAFPYNAELATYLASLPLALLPSPAFPVSAMTFFNLLLQLMFGLLLARVLRPAGTPFGTVPSWAACAGGILLATLLNPGFSTRVSLSSYAEPTIAVTIGMIGWLGVGTLGRMAEGKPVGKDLWLLALIALATINVKQVSVFLMGTEFACFVLLGAVDRRIGWWRALHSFALAALPAILLYVAWRGFVLDHFVSGELKLLPSDQWPWHILPETLKNIVLTIGQKLIYFGPMLAAVGLALWLPWSRGLDLATRLLVVLAGVFIAYNGFLIMIYVIHMGTFNGWTAHSYFRYHTHLSMLLMTALTLVFLDFWRGRSLLLPAPLTGTAGRALVIGTLVLVPIVLIGRVRHDLQMPQPLALALEQRLAAAVSGNDKLALLLPGDNNALFNYFRAMLALAPPRHPDMPLYYSNAVDRKLLDSLSDKGYTLAFLSCAPDEFAELPRRTALLLRHDGTGWQIAESWPYPPRDRRDRWISELGSKPFCE
jgi:hypothetical protein